MISIIGFYKNSRSFYADSSSFHSSSFNLISERSYCWLSKESKVSYVTFLESTVHKKAEEIFLHTLANTLGIFNLQRKTSNPKQSWEILRHHLSTVHSYQLAPFDDNNPIENLQSLMWISQKPLIKEKLRIDSPNLSDYIFTPTEMFWAFRDVEIPFNHKHEEARHDLSKIQYIFDQCPFFEVLPTINKKLSEADEKIQHYALLNAEEDAIAATLLATHYLDQSTLLYEVGCWNAQNLLNLLFYASIKNKTPKYCIGTDINYRAIKMAESISALLAVREPFVQFHPSNALYPLDPSILNIHFEKVVKLALRLIPVLEPSLAKALLSKTKETFRSNKDVLIVSYATPKGARYEENLKRIADSEQPQFTKNSFAEGVTFFQEFDPKELLPSYLQQRQDHRCIINTYYSEKGFSMLAGEAGFKIQDTIVVQCKDNERAVVTLSPKE